MITLGKVAAVALSVAVIETTVGGWAVITVENPPDHLVAGASYRLEFTIRQHGTRPMSGLEPSLRLRTAGAIPVAGGDRIRAIGAGGEGRYAATFTVPETDRVVVTVKSGFGPSDLTLMPIPVVRTGQAAPSLTPAERGRRLFIAKGCGTCHINSDVPEFRRENRSYTIGPELTGRRLDAGYLRQRLSDPASLPAIGAGDIRMPTLGLSGAEIDALVALLTGPRQTAGQYGRADRADR
jgi:hypothetical protein